MVLYSLQSTLRPSGRLGYSDSFLQMRTLRFGEPVGHSQPPPPLRWLLDGRAGVRTQTRISGFFVTSGHLAKVTSLGLGQTFFIQIFSFPCSCQYQQICRKLSDPDLCRLCGEKTRGEAEQEKVDRRHLAGGREKAVEHSVHILCSAEPLLPHQ